MLLQDRLKKIEVENEVEQVPEYSTAGQIVKRIGQDPMARALVRKNPDGSVTIFKPNDRPTLRDGDRFETQVQVEGG